MKTEKELNLISNEVGAIYSQIKSLQRTRMTLDDFEYRGLKGVIDIGHRVYVSLGPVSIQYPTDIDTLTIRYNGCIILEYCQHLPGLFSPEDVELKDVEVFKKIIGAVKNRVTKVQRDALDNFRSTVRAIIDDTEEVAK